MVELPPIFKNTTIGIDDIGDYMKEYAERHGVMKKPRRSLISSYFAQEMAVTTPLLK